MDSFFKDTAGTLEYERRKAVRIFNLQEMRWSSSHNILSSSSITTQ